MFVGSQITHFCIAEQCECRVSWVRVHVPKRSTAQSVQAKGVYAGAVVMRGSNWIPTYKEQDGKNVFSYDQTSCITYGVNGNN